MKKIIKYGSIVVISLAILISCNVNLYDHDVFAEEKNEKQNTETDIICNWPEDIIDPGPALPQYLSVPKIMNILNTNKGIKVQAGHCTGGDLDECDGVTHLFNAMSPITHRGKSTALSGLINDNLYTEIIADGVHFSDDTLKLILKSKPHDKILLISDCLPITNSDMTEMNFCGKKIYYDGKKATDSNKVIAGSTNLLDKIIKRLLNMNIDAFQFIENSYNYHNIELNGYVWWNDQLEIIAVEKEGHVLYRKDYM